jgi:U4/U6.U5 tri-snRNP-associated protein 2
MPAWSVASTSKVRPIVQESHYAKVLVAMCCQGRGQHSHAYTHSVQVGHRVWLNLDTLQFYCLPDNYEIIDASLEDIKVMVGV